MSKNNKDESHSEEYVGSLESVDDGLRSANSVNIDEYIKHVIEEIKFSANTLDWLLDEKINDEILNKKNKVK
tara:strand:+ start:2083 stop:2298 length:216 start_codon:yes stop_codon:yes gene_type:complete